MTDKADRPAWTLRYLPSVLKTLRKLDRADARSIVEYLDRRIRHLDDPRSTGKGLQYNRSGQWRYRVGDFRIIVEIQDRALVVLVVDVIHRSAGY